MINIIIIEKTKVKIQFFITFKDIADIISAYLIIHSKISLTVCVCVSVCVCLRVCVCSVILGTFSPYQYEMQNLFLH